jgi:hypothetical protein
VFGILKQEFLSRNGTQFNVPLPSSV